MSDLFARILDFFVNKNISISMKFVVPISVILFVLAFDNYYGFSYLFVNSQKVDYLLKIEDAKKKSKQDSTIYCILNKMEYDFINRKNIFVRFGDLFDYKEFLNDRTNEQIDSVIVKEQTHRNQLLHTVSASFCFILMSIGLVFTLLALPFLTQKDRRKEIYIGIISGLMLLIFLIWLTQWAFGLIPIIYNRPWINYSLQFLLNIIIFTIIYRKQEK